MSIVEQKLPEFLKQSMREIFEAFATNNQISIQDLQTISILLHIQLPQNFLETSGYQLDFGEFCAFVAKFLHEFGDLQESEEAFRILDADQKQYIESADLMVVQQQIGMKLPESTCERMIADLQNRDRVVDIDQFQKLAISKPRK